MSHLVKIFTLILLSLAIHSCSKVESNNNNPLIEISSPNHNQLFLLPDTINIKFSVNYDHNIEYIRVSIVDKNMTPVSDQEFLYPDKTTFEGNIYLPITLSPQVVNFPPYYVQVTVSTYNQISHAFQEIILLANQIKYKGFYLICKDGVNTLSVNYFNNKYQQEYSSIVSGNFLGSDISNKANMLFITTNTPDRVRAIDCSSGEIIWIKEPQLPYPEFNYILVNNNIVYLSTDIGRIIGLTTENGIQIFNTPVLPDSAPANICITDNYLIADTKLRNSGSTIWATYYKQTGIKYQLFPTNFKTTAIYDLEDNNRVIAFSNNNLTGQIFSFNIENNTIENNIFTANIEIQQSCKIDKNNFLFSSGNKLFHYDKQTNSYLKILETDETIYSLKFNHMKMQLFVVHLYKTVIVSFPGLATIETIETASQIKEAELLFGY